jgi:hypothetical protein
MTWDVTRDAWHETRAGHQGSQNHPVIFRPVHRLVLAPKLPRFGSVLTIFAPFRRGRPAGRLGALNRRHDKIINNLKQLTTRNALPDATRPTSRAAPCAYSYWLLTIYYIYFILIYIYYTYTCTLYMHQCTCTCAVCNLMCTCMHMCMCMHARTRARALDLSYITVTITVAWRHFITHQFITHHQFKFQITSNNFHCFSTFYFLVSCVVSSLGNGHFTRSLNEIA